MGECLRETSGCKDSEQEGINEGFVIKRILQFDTLSSSGGMALVSTAEWEAELVDPGSEEERAAVG